MYFYLKTLLISIVLFSSTIILAQTSGAENSGSQTLKGTISLAGEVYYAYSNVRSEGVHNLMIAPNTGYFITDNLMLGLNFAYNYQKHSKFNSWWHLGVGPSFEYYFGSTPNKFFARVGVLSGFSESGTSQTYFQPAVGYNISVSKNVALQPALTIGIGKNNTSVMFGLGIRNFIF